MEYKLKYSVSNGHLSSIIPVSFISIGNSGTPQDADPAADATAEAHEAEVAEVVDPASEVSDQSWIMEEPCGEGVFRGTTCSLCILQYMYEYVKYQFYEM